MNDRAAGSDDGDSVEAALTAFLSFREEDMQQWRRAGAMSGLTHSAMLALSTILRADQRGRPLRQVDLRSALHLSPAGVSTIAEDLQARGLIERHPSPTDRRAHHLHAGPSAAPFLDRLRRVDDAFREHLAELTGDQRAAFIRALDYMRELGSAEYR